MDGRISIVNDNYKECTFNDTPIDGSIVFNSKLFHNDICTFNDGVFSNIISKRNLYQIGGILKLSNSVIYMEDNKTLYEFIPINRKYPKFLVASEIKNNLINRREYVSDYFVVIEFKHWNNKFPYGIIKYSIGSVEKTINQYEILHYYYPEHPFIKKEKIGCVFDISLNFYNISDVSEIYSIDPIGCMDIDNALSYDSVNNKIGIHIADVIHTINPLPYNYSTIYAPHKNINMLSDTITYNYCSLIQGTVKPVISCWINMSTFQIELKREHIRVKNNCSYDDIENNNISSINVIMDFAKKLNARYSIIDVVFDSHTMVELYMIFLNQYIATLLRNDKVIYRNQEPQKFAEYSFENKGHFSLKQKYYTHFTSPIRRFVDQYVHKILINKLFKKMDILDISVDDINTYDKQLKKINLHWNYLSVSTKIVDGSAYALEFLQFDSKRVEFKLLDYNISINNKLLFVCINNTTIKINNIDYELNKVYILPLYIIHNNTFPNIMIKFI